MAKYIYYFLRVLTALTLAFFGFFLVFKVYRSWIDPIDVLKKKNIQTKVIYENYYEAKDIYSKRIYADVILNTGEGGDAHFTLSLPEKIPEGGLKCIFVAAGLDTGKKSLNYINDHSNYAIVAYEYPSVIRSLKNKSLFLKLRLIREKILSVPQQWVSIVLWMQKQPWCRKEPISIAGYSFGSIFVPAAYHLAQVENIQLGPGVIAYGGAGLNCLLRANLKLPNWIKVPVAWLGSLLFRPIDPIVHAKYLRNNFLLINGLYDRMVPSRCRKKLQAIIPEPKEIINLHTEHMMPENQPLLNRLIRITKDFLENQNEAKREITPLANASVFLPKTENQIPPTMPILSLKLYSTAGASSKLSA